MSSSGRRTPTSLDEPLGSAGIPALVDASARSQTITLEDRSGAGDLWEAFAPRLREDPVQLGPYRLTRRVGEGGMGVVFETRTPDSDHPVALKLINGLSPESIYRFKREFRALEGVSHPNVVRLFALHFSEGQLFYTMELIEGVDIVRWLCGPPTKEDGSQYRPCRDFALLRTSLRQLVEGLNAIHRAGLLHRDLKPSNVLVDERGRVVVLDFGLVRAADARCSTTMTEEGIVLGTPLYMSPEQAGQRRLDRGSDWYSLGVLLYELLTGAPPHRDLDKLDLYAAKQSEAPPSPGQLLDGVPADLDALCMELLDPDPHRRPGAEEIRRRLGGEARPTISPPDRARGLFGRSTELAMLRKAFHLSLASRPVIQLLEGEAGVGKSALMARFLRDLPEDALVFQGRCSPREQIPYQALDPILDALALRLRILAEESDVRGLVPEDVQAVTRLFPVLLSVPLIAASAPMRFDPEDPSRERRRAIEALRDLLGRLTEAHPVVLAIDDVQWADPDSLALVEALLVHPDAPGLMLIASFRTRAERENEGLQRWFDRLEVARAELHHLEVGPLMPEDARKLARARSRLANLPNDEVADRIASESGGHPLFIDQLVEHVAREGVQRTGQVSELALDDVLSRRLERLQEGELHALRCLAIAAAPLPRDVLARLAGQAGHRSIDRLERELLVTSSTGVQTRTVEMVHDLVREALLSRVPDEAIPDMHRDVAEALLAWGPVQHQQLAHHLRNSDQLEQALQHTLAAADQAEKALAFDRAAELYQAALELGRLGPRASADIEERLGLVLTRVGRLREAASALLRASRDGTDPDRFEASRLAASHLLATGHAQAGRDLLESLLTRVGAALPRNSTYALGSLMWTRGLLALRGLTVPESGREVDPAQARQLDVMWTASLGLMHIDPVAAGTYHARHLLAALRTGEPMRCARALALEGVVQCSMFGERGASRGRDALRAASALADLADCDHARGIVLEATGNAAASMCEWDKAVDYLDRATEHGRDRGLDHGHELALAEIHSLTTRTEQLGQLRRSGERARELLRDCARRHHPYAEGLARCVHARSLLARGDVARAAEELDRVAETTAPDFAVQRLYWLAVAAAMALQQGRGRDAHRMVERHAQGLERSPVMRVPVHQLQLVYLRGLTAVQAAVESGLDAELLRHGTRMARKLQASGFEPYQGKGGLIAAGLAHLHGHHSRAMVELRGAIDRFEPAGMRADASAARWCLARISSESQAQKLRGEAMRYFEGQRIAHPNRWVAGRVPGFEEDELRPAFSAPTR